MWFSGHSAWSVITKERELGSYSSQLCGVTEGLHRDIFLDWGEYRIRAVSLLPRMFFLCGEDSLDHLYL